MPGHASTSGAVVGRLVTLLLPNWMARYLLIRPNMFDRVFPRHICRIVAVLFGRRI